MTINGWQRRDGGLAHIPEDRIHVGLNLETNLDENLIVSRYKLGQFNRAGFLNRRSMRDFAIDVIKRFSIAAAVPGGGISRLSGGNMQKLILGRALSVGDQVAAGAPPVLIVANQPTWGLDVGAVAGIHGKLLAAAGHGAAILIISEDLDEIFAIADRVAVMYKGALGAVRPVEQWTLAAIGLAMAGNPAGETLEASDAA